MSEKGQTQPWVVGQDLARWLDDKVDVELEAATIHVIAVEVLVVVVTPSQ